MNREYPDFASGWHTASQLALRLGNERMALDAIRRATRLERDRPLWLLQEARCWLRLGQADAARAITGQLQRRTLETAYENATLGLLLTDLDERREAVASYRAAASIDPEDSRHFYNLGCLQRTLGDLDEAERNFDAAIALAPRDYEAWKLRSELRTWTADDNHVASLEALLEDGISDNKGRANICYALAKELEDLGEPRRSFEYLRQGAVARRRQMRYDVNRDLETMATIERTFSAERLGEPGAGSDSEEPIFILGMPRTGTTLLERVLGRHADIFAAGELTNFTVEMMKLVGEEAAGRQLSRDELVGVSAGIDFRALGDAYVTSTRPRTGATRHFTDKLPLNYLYVGLIHRALPRAKIIHVQRDPMDTCYAVFKTLFTDAYPFSYDLEELARYYVAYHRLMEHWHRSLPGVMHTVRYEELVEDTEAVARGALKYCGLEWQEDCLDFHASSDVSTTASAAQVRKPVYGSSVGRWRDYERELRPVFDILQEVMR
ncbi:MAG: sulfotransferase [Woeseiaceae bacterium]